MHTENNADWQQWEQEKSQNNLAEAFKMNASALNERIKQKLHLEIASF